ncbi:MAG: LysR family transcriptional regulator [Oscillospiraceae bacterium]|jgi:DNA-binding transcriptional LysR family regulator|nr:LysR family transcriptional regulator [Oscillospiraceae bacterium]
MNLKQARCIRAIAREGGVTAAARKLYVSQPALSQMLRQVETELGMPLFDRSVSPFRLTFAGEKYLEAADIILAAHRRLENQLQEIREENSGRLRLGISVQRAGQVLPLALPWFAMQYPHVSLELTERGSAHLEELVSRGEVDLALAAIDSTSPRLSYELIEREVTGILAGGSSSLAGRFPPGTAVSVEDAAEDTFISLKEGHSIRVVQDALFRRYGLRPPILLETDSLEVAKRTALGTGSCMLCSDIYVDGMVRRRGAFYPLRDYENHRHFYACYPKGGALPQYAAGFIRIVKQVLEQRER